MDRIKLKTRCGELFHKYKFVALVLLVGIILMVVPGKEETVQLPEQETVCQPDMEEKLAQILSQVEGAGKVSVFLSLEEGELTLYQQDEDLNSDGSGRFDTVIVTDGNRSQSGLVQQVIPPKYQGVIVVCQGAQRASVRLNIIEAVAKVTGLSTDRISVLKMK
jgi:stage III sporulation protein AG